MDAATPTGGLSRCLSCYQPFPLNNTLEGFPHGRRVAYDPVRGRLWAVCPDCGRWTLAPMETRWETLESLERLVRDDATLLKQGENVALHEVGELEIVRVGRAGQREEAWWRYGHEFLSRQARARSIATRGKLVDALVVSMLIGIPFWGHSDSTKWIDKRRRRSFGRDVWRGLSYCPGCGTALDAIRFEEGRDLHLRPDGSSFRLWYWCPHCGVDRDDAGHTLSGLGAEHVLRRVLAYENFAGGSESEVEDAMTLVGEHVVPEAVAPALAGDGVVLGEMAAPRSLAVEIALNSGIEAALLSAELSDLEARWREEEALAAIIDGELTPLRPRSTGGEGNS
jgi:hypothetical protein